MGSLSEDLILNTGFLNLGLKFFNIYREIRKLKRKNYKLISTNFPVFNELLYGTNAFPVFTPRIPIADFDILEKALRSTKLAEDVFGKDVSSKGVKLVSTVLDRAILRQLDEIFNNFTRYVEICEKSPVIFPCFASKLYYGAMLKNKDLLDAVLVFGTLCDIKNQCNENISKLIQGIPFVNFPLFKEGTNLDQVVNEIKNYMKTLEGIAGPIQEEKIIEYIDLTNKVKKLYMDFFNLFKKDEYYPISPSSFRLMLSMLTSIFIDLISSPTYVFKNLTLLNEHLSNLKKGGKGYNGSRSLRVLLIPSLEGFEHNLSEYLATKDVYLFYFDFIFYKLMAEIETSGDWLKNYAKFYLESNKAWNPESLLTEWLKMIKFFEVDAVIFNSSVGCNYLSNMEQKIGDELMKLNIPMKTIKFERLGKDLKQINNIVEAFIDEIRKKK